MIRAQLGTYLFAAGLVALGFAVTATAVLPGASRKADAHQKQSSVSNLSPAEQKLKRQLRREERFGEPERPVSVDASATTRCAEPGSDDAQFSLPNVRLFYRNWKGEEPSYAPGVNEAIGCFYETGSMTKFGFQNVIEGESFGIAEGSGDFVAFSVSWWDAAGGNDDGFDVWNMRTSHREFHRDSCSTEVLDCYIADIELASHGSFAYAAVREHKARIYVKEAGGRRTIGAIRNPSDGNPAIVRSHGMLYWLSPRGRLRSTAFP